MNRRKATAALAACLVLAGCTADVVDLPPSLETVRVLREQHVPPLALGAFVPASADENHSIDIRILAMKPPKGRTFAQFLGATFETELKTAGTLDPASPLQLSGVLTENRASEDMKHGQGALAVRITLARAGTVLLAKDYRVESQWHSDFIGALAYEEAMTQYNAMYALLARKVLSDPEFVAATRH